MEVMDVVRKFHKKIDYDAHKSCEVKYPTANDCIECCSKPYFEQVNIDYSCAQKRKIYVARYAPAYISEVRSAFNVTPRDYAEELSRKSMIKVASIGGGPGTDIAGFKKWVLTNLDEDNDIEKIKFLRVDIHEDWDDVSPELISLYDAPDIEYEYKKIVCDITQEPINSQSFKSFDVIMMSYILSEIDSEDIRKVAKNISKVISGKTLLVINDRPQDVVIQKIDQFITAVGGGNQKIVEPTERDHCGESYPDEIFGKVGATIFRKSIRYNVLIEK
ncbi:MAG: class I SAM-dependent methyltransferase [Halopseudomonas sabulinigri]